MKKTPIAIAIASLFALSGIAHAGPEDGNVVAGQAGIQQQGGNTTIDQSSQRAIINWKSFDIGASERVQHNMPNANSHALHRVIGGGGASQLAGELRSNGNIYLVNPAGVVIHKGARIDVGGFLATTNNIADEDFMAGKLRFDQPGQPGAVIVNLGRISVKDSGFAALVAPTVRNDGIIAARLGRITLGSGNGYTLDFYGDEMITFTAPELLVDGLYTPEGERLGVTNNGQIKAEGGVVLLTASQLDSIVESVVNNGGTISAASAELEGGKIVFRAVGEGVDVVNTGSLDASSEAAAGGTVRITGDGEANISGQISAQGATVGGVIDISAKQGTVIDNANITAAGESGGLVRLGGEFQGGKEKQNTEELKEGFVGRFGEQEKLASTQNLTVKNSTVDAGKDGTLIAWSEGRTEIDAQLSGKYVETSGKTLSIQEAPTSQKGGTWLIDPWDVVITETSSNTSDWGASDIKASAIGGYLNLGNSLSIMADNSIQIKDDILYSTSSALSFWASSIEVANGVNLGGNQAQLGFWANNQIMIGDNAKLTADRMEFRGAGTYPAQVNNVFLGVNSSLNAELVAMLMYGGLTMMNNAKIIANRVDVNNWMNNVPLYTNSITMYEGAEINGNQNVFIITSSLDMNGAKIASSDGSVRIAGEVFVDSSGEQFDLPGSLHIAMNDSGDKISAINSKDRTGLIFKGLSISGTNEGTRLASDSEIKLNLKDGESIVIPKGTKDMPIISAPNVIFQSDVGLDWDIGTGHFILNSYSIKTSDLEIHGRGFDYYTYSISITGVGDGPHIFGLDPSAKADILAMSSAYPTLVFQTSDGVQYKEGKVLGIDIDPDKFIDLDGMDAAQLYRAEWIVYANYFIRRFGNNANYQQSDFAQVTDDMSRLIRELMARNWIIGNDGLPMLEAEKNTLYSLTQAYFSEHAESGYQMQWDATNLLNSARGTYMLNFISRNTGKSVSFADYSNDFDMLYIAYMEELAKRRDLLGASVDDQVEETEAEINAVDKLVYRELENEEWVTLGGCIYCSSILPEPDPQPDPRDPAIVLQDAQNALQQFLSLLYQPVNTGESIAVAEDLIRELADVVREDSTFKLGTDVSDAVDALNFLIKMLGSDMSLPTLPDVDFAIRLIGETPALLRWINGTATTKDKLEVLALLGDASINILLKVGGTPAEFAANFTGKLTALFGFSEGSFESLVNVIGDHLDLHKSNNQMVAERLNGISHYALYMDTPLFADRVMNVVNSMADTATPEQILSAVIADYNNFCNGYLINSVRMLADYKMLDPSTKESIIRTEQNIIEMQDIVSTDAFLQSSHGQRLVSLIMLTLNVHNAEKAAR